MDHFSDRDIGAMSVSPQASKIKITNIVCYFTCTVALFYALYFWLSLQQPFLAGLNVVFVIGYGISLVLSHFNHYRVAKYWFFTTLLIHVYLLTTLIFSPSAGFHFYYLLLPTGVFLLLDEKDQLARIVIMALGGCLFFLCHNSTNEPLITLSLEAEYWIFSSTVVVIMTEIYFVMSVFSKAISTHEKELKEMATIDALTSVNNRRTFMIVGDEMFSYAARYQKTFSVMLLDVDHFKNINDRCGHQVGDKTLQIIASILKNNVRESDLIARYGGEEFIILLPDTNSEDAYLLAESLRKKIATHAINLSDGDDIYCTASFGISEYGQHHEDLSQLVNLADKALYNAKNLGRDRVIVSKSS